MGVRADVAAALKTGIPGVPVYSAIHDGMAVPSIVLYPDARLLSRDAETFGGLVWHYVATVLVGRNDLPGVFDLTETLIGKIILAELGDGISWTSAGNYRTEAVAGVDYVAADVYLDAYTLKERNT